MGVFFFLFEVKCISVKWIYKIKLNQYDEIIKYKKRFVAKGYLYEYGIDYIEVYIRVVRMDIIMIILVIIVQKVWEIYQIDMELVFFYGIFIEDIYI